MFIFKSKYLYFAGLSPSEVYVAPHNYFESYKNLTPNIIITIIIILIIIIPGKLMIIIFTMAARPAATELAPKIIAGIPALTLPGQRMMIIIIFMIIRSLGSW